MFIYIGLFILVIIISYFGLRKEKLLYIVAVLMITFLTSIIAGCRDLGVGTDTNIYTESYFNVAKHSNLYKILFGSLDISESSRGYLLINYIGVFFADNYWIALFLTSFLIWSTILWGIWKLNKSYAHYHCQIWIFITLFLLYFHNRSYNYMRQFCALSFVFCSYSYYLDRKWLKSILLFIVAFSFHTSAIVTILIPIFYYITYYLTGNRRFYKNIIVAFKSQASTIVPILIPLHNFTSGSRRLHKNVIVLLVTITFVYVVFLMNFESIIMYLGSSQGLILEVYAERYSSDNEAFWSAGLGKQTYILFLAELFVIYYGYIKKIINQQMFIYILLLHFTFLGTYALTLISVYLNRLSYYFYIIDLWYISLILSAKKANRLLLYAYLLTHAIIWYYYFIYGNANETYPYTSRILNI